ncbi:ABC-2 type transport system permease protein [Thermanaeromonas toyohensis ToBE]|uniref:ABC-2 type transport system permease protein n=1 Tax=Thermanaeromonas toyohensis ToBE TaxID=698762 RepID=A0A1W1W181_9FIRM|nr:ABC transporter permease subunit [Thermanaeromonas toyohensis]SMB99375.1 ABC-2 type transport system permease protein [Thermanaeromonas toyohensis ToBE]
MKDWQVKLKEFINWWREAFRSSGGLKVIFFKELADNLSSTRMGILFSLVAVACLSALYVAAQSIRQSVGQEGSAFVFLRLFTTSGGSLPPFISFLSFLGPLLGLALGFDAINGEYNKRTLSRLLAQPIYRDDVINGKFLAGIAVLAIMIAALGLLVAGLGLVFIGVPPRGEEIGRILAYLMVSIIYVAFWLSISLLFSLLFRQAATSALAGIAVWLFCAIFAPMLAGIIADGLFPAGENAPAELILRNAVWKQNLSRLSPTTLYDEATLYLLNPGVRTLGPVLIQQVIGAIPGFLPLSQSLLLIWPHLVGLIAGTLIIFALAYYYFMRQEIRTS